LIIAHRGASAYAPENSLAAFNLALSEGAEGIEFDVRLAADGVPVVFHDESLERIGGQKTRVGEMNSEQLSEVNIGTWFNRRFPEQAMPAYSNERIPSLTESIDLLSGFGGRIYIELKCSKNDVRQLVRAVANILRNSNLTKQVIIKSFTLSAISIARELLPGVRTAALFEPGIMTLLRKKRFICDIAEKFGAEELSVHYSLVSRRLMQRAAEAGMPVTAWTVDKPEWLQKRINMGLYAVITNNPGLLLQSVSG
jgi:glycerophosphoryl diester phosphodiesterase